MTRAMAGEDELYRFLDAAGIAFTRHEHPPLHTVEESRALRDALPGGHCKSLFLKERKGGLWLVVCLEDREIRMKHLEKAIGAKRLSFGAPDLLWSALGVRPGAVTPLALINDREAQAIRVVLDSRMAQTPVLNYHPLHNRATLAISSDGLSDFIAACGHRPLLVDFDAIEALSRADRLAQTGARNA
jgi:Ala-tRNA(Pro) deacylase